MALMYFDRGEAQLAVPAGTVLVGSITKTMQSIMSKDHESWHW